MCSSRSFLAASALAVISAAALVQVSATGQAGKAQPALETGVANSQIVDRRHKGNRLTSPDSPGRGMANSRPLPRPPQPVSVGCDPAFSPLSSSARLNYPTRCMTDNTPRTGVRAS